MDATHGLTQRFLLLGGSSRLVDTELPDNPPPELRTVVLWEEGEGEGEEEDFVGSEEDGSGGVVVAVMIPPPEEVTVAAPAVLVKQCSSATTAATAVLATLAHGDPAEDEMSKLEHKLVSKARFSPP